MAEGDIALLVEGATCYFDVSPPWLTRLVERSPKRTLRAVDGVSFEVARGQTLSPFSFTHLTSPRQREE